MGGGGGGLQTSRILPLHPPLDKDPELRGCFQKQSGAAPENDSISPQINLALYIKVLTLFTSIDLNEFKPDMLFPLRSTGNNPLLARNDQRLFSPHNIHMYSRDNVLRIDRMIMFLSFYKFPQFLI